MDTIAWERWNATGTRTSRSKAHIEDFDRDGFTLCGKRIPDEPGIEVGNGRDYGHGTCKRCEAKSDDQ